MKKKPFVTGFILGGLLFGSISAMAATAVTAVPSTQGLYVDGVKVSAQAYNIDGINYFKLRDIGQAVNFSVAYDEQNDVIQLNTSKPYGTETLAKEPEIKVQTEQKSEITPTPEQKTPAQSTAGLTANKSVAPQFDANHRPISIATNTGDIIYGTGNDRNLNPNAISGWDGCFEITGDGKPAEPALGSYNPNWQGYKDIKWPNPVPAYSNIANSVWGDGRKLFVFNAHETQRLIDELYRTLYNTPECFTDGNLNCKVMIGMTNYGFNTNHFYPYRDSEVDKHVIGGKRVYMAYAVDIYQNGMFDCTKYIIEENGGYDYKTNTIELWDELITSDTAVIRSRQDKKCLAR